LPNKTSAPNKGKIAQKEAQRLTTAATAPLQQKPTTHNLAAALRQKKMRHVHETPALRRIPLPAAAKSTDQTARVNATTTV